MRTYKIWDKKEEIVQGVNNDYILNSEGRTPNDDFFLVYENGVLTNIETVREVTPVYKIDNTLSIEEIAQAYLDIRQANDEKVIQEQATLGQLTDTVDVLKQQNADLTYALMMGGLI